MKTDLQCLVVDDQAEHGEFVANHIRHLGQARVQVATGVREAWDIVRGGQVSFVVTDWRMPDSTGKPDLGGKELLGLIRKNRATAGVFVAILTEYPSEAVFAQGLEAGADTFLIKPAQIDWLRVALWQAARAKQDRPAAENHLQQLADDLMLGGGMRARALAEEALRYAGMREPILLRGETGTGKSFLARLIHQYSPRKGEPFVEVSCPAISPYLFESVFFGHKKGAFAGAFANHNGLFQEAHRGTLFLDEVGDLPLEFQAKLLTATQDPHKQVFRRVGGEEITVDVRIVSATNKDVLKLQQQGKFREELAGRLFCLSLRVPALRELDADDRRVVIVQAIKRATGGTRKVFSEEAVDRLVGYTLPKNRNSLHNCIMQCLAGVEGDLITGADMHEVLCKQASTQAVQEPSCEDFSKGHPSPALRIPVPCQMDGQPTSLDQILRRLQLDATRRALKLAKGKVYGPDGAAMLLGMHARTIGDWIRDWEARGVSFAEDGRNATGSPNEGAQQASKTE